VGGDVHPRTRGDAFQETNRADHTDRLAMTGTPVRQTASTRTPRRGECLGAAIELKDAAEPSISHAANRITPTIALLAATPPVPRRRLQRGNDAHESPPSNSTDFGLSTGTRVGGEGMGPHWRLTRSGCLKGVAATMVKDRGFLPALARHTRSPAIKHRHEAGIPLLKGGREARLVQVGRACI
jgi:hypothetical protein